MKIAAHISSQPQQNSILKTILNSIYKINEACTVTLFSNVQVESLNTNETFVKINVKPNKKIAAFIWSHYTLPSLLKKSIPDVFISEFGYSIENKNTNHFLFFSNADFLETLFYTSKKAFVKSLFECKKIFVTEDFIKDLLIEKYAIDKEKIVVTYYDITENTRLLGYEQKAAIKEKFTSGVDYFLYEINNEQSVDLITVLKAFSQFKKWQKSSIKLVFYTSNKYAQKLIKDFNLYKYKDDVVFVNEAAVSLHEIVATSFLLIHFSAYKPNSIATCAMQNYVPIIAADTTKNRSLFEDAAMYAAATDVSIAAQIQFLYKDEFACRALQLNATAIIQKYQAQKAAVILYQHISIK